MLRQLQSQSKKREFTMTTKIVRQEDWPIWRGNLTFELARHKLDRYILTDVPRPSDDQPDELQTWLQDRSDIDRYIRSLIGDTKAWDAMEGMGWNRNEVDPKKTFDTLTEAYESGTDDEYAVLYEEFATICREKYASMEALRVRLNYLRNRLDSDNSPFKMHNGNGYLWPALRAISKTYLDLYNRSVTSLKNGTLTWAILMKEFQQIVVTEKANTALANVKVDNNKTDPNKKDKDSGGKQKNDSDNGNGNGKSNSSNSGNKDKEKGDRINCAICNMLISPGWKHCIDCNHHIPPDSECWWCHPEKAADTWKNKTLAIQKKAERQMTSTTGPLHQQSGVQNASTSKPPKTVMFQTGFANIALSQLTSFHPGPRSL